MDDKKLIAYVKRCGFEVLTLDKSSPQPVDDWQIGRKVVVELVFRDDRSISPYFHFVSGYYDPKLGEIPEALWYSLYAMLMNHARGLAMATAEIARERADVS